MSIRVSVAPIKQSIVVEAPIERAFKVFTEDFGIRSIATARAARKPKRSSGRTTLTWAMPAQQRCPCAAN